MAKVPASTKFNKMAAVFNEAARTRLCESSGSEHYSPDPAADDLSDLVNSFIERDGDDSIESHNHDNHLEQHDSELQHLEGCCSNSETKNHLLLNLLNKLDDVADKIRAETKLACGTIGETSSHAFKRRLMCQLRDLGYDAGLCKSRWEKLGRHPAGEYEYVDVNVGGNRLIIEVCLGAEFEIARPSSNYTALLDVFPRVFVGKAEEMKQIVRLMCSAIRESMKEMSLHVPPWRKNGYMQVKWLGPYRRTTDGIPTRKRPESDRQSFGAKRSIGFQPFPVKTYYCRDNFVAAKVGFKPGYLTHALNSDV